MIENCSGAAVAAIPAPRRCDRPVAVVSMYCTSVFKYMLGSGVPWAVAITAAEVCGAGWDGMG